MRFGSIGTDASFHALQVLSRRATITSEDLAHSNRLRNDDVSDHNGTYQPYTLLLPASARDGGFSRPSAHPLTERCPEEVEDVSDSESSASEQCAQYQDRDSDLRQHSHTSGPSSSTTPGHPGSLGLTPAPLADDARLDSAVRRVEDAVVHPPEGGSTVRTEAPCSPSHGVRLSLSPFRPSEGSSPSAASDTPPNITPPIAVNAAPPITVNTAPEAVARPLWTAPAAWRPAGRYVRTRSSPILGRGSHSEVVRVVDVLGGHVRARKRVAFVQAPPRSLWFEIEALTRLARHKGI
ncbi:hypothetical protein CF326_g9462, partial [Tilletia indica]